MSLPMEVPKIEIKQMPTQEVLEEYLRGMFSAHVTVRFNYEEGLFEGVTDNEST